MQLVINFPNPKLPNELAALAINLSLNHNNAELMTRGKCLMLLMDRLVKTEDSKLCTVIRNIATWTYTLQEQLPDDIDDSDSDDSDADSDDDRRERKEGKEGGGGGRGGGRGEGQDGRKEPKLRYQQMGMWAPFIKAMCRLAKKTENSDLMLQARSSLAAAAAAMPRRVSVC